jgi:ppGpp synthetase/RelA/SpoT-type nucleotidyltranferase
VSHRSKLSYEQARLLAEIAESDLRGRVVRALRSLGDPNLVRATLAKSRIKELDSLRRKARRNRREEALRNAPDFVGLRIVCNNLQDVRWAADLIRAALQSDDIAVSEQEYLSSPGKAGYRAIHLNVRVPTRIHSHERSD